MKLKKIITLTLVAMLVLASVLTLTACDTKATLIGMQKGTTSESYIEGDEEVGFDGYANLTAKKYNNASLAVTDMKNGNIGMVIVDNGTANALTNEIDGIKMIDIALSTESYAYAVALEDDALKTNVDAILDTIMTDGTLDAIFDKYNNEETDEYAPVPAGTYDATKDQLVVATNAEFAPYEFKQGENFVGIDMEVAKIIADELNMELVIKDMPFDAVVTSIGTNGVDIAMSGLTITPNRAKSVKFTKAYYEESYQVIIVNEDNTMFDDCTTKEDVEAILKGLK